MKRQMYCLFALSALGLSACMVDDVGSSQEVSSSALSSSSMADIDHFSSSSIGTLSIQNLSVEWMDGGYHVSGIMSWPQGEMVELVVLINGTKTDWAWDITKIDTTATVVDLKDLSFVLNTEYVVKGSNVLTMMFVHDSSGDTLSKAEFVFTGYGDLAEDTLVDSTTDSVSADSSVKDVYLISAGSSLILGAKASAYASAVDLDSWTTYKTSEITTSNAGTIDLVFGYWNSIFTLAPPAYALSAPLNDIGATLQGKLVSTDASIVKIFGQTFTDFSIMSDAKNAYLEKVDSSFVVATGDLFLVKTDKWAGGNEGIFVVGVESVSEVGFYSSIRLKALKAAE